MNISLQGILTGCILFFSLNAFAQDIKITIKGFEGDTIYYGKYLGKRLVKDKPVVKNHDGSFDIKTSLPPGLYNIVYTIANESSNRGFPIVITHQARNFSVSCQVIDPQKNMIVTGSPETNLYLQYYTGMDQLLEQYANSVDAWRVFQNEEKFRAMYAIEKRIGDFQSITAQSNPNTFIANIIQQTKLNVPAPSGTVNEMAAKRQSYYDQFKINDVKSNDIFWSCPLSILWLDLYAIRSHDVNMLNAGMRVKKILDLIAPNPAGYNYYLNYLLNSFQRMSKNNLDQIFVTLVREYVEKGKATFLSDQERSKDIATANNIERLKVGNKAPDATLYKEDNTAIKISDVHAPYTLLVFWAPDCSHCKKELPIIKSTLDRYKNKNVQMVTSCTKLGKELSACYQYLKTNFPNTNWLNLGDPGNAAHMGNLYNVSGTPVIYLLDEKKNIMYRRRGEMEDYEWDHLFASLK